MDAKVQSKCSPVCIYLGSYSFYALVHKYFTDIQYDNTVSLLQLLPTTHSSSGPSYNHLLHPIIVEVISCHDYRLVLGL